MMVNTEKPGSAAKLNLLGVLVPGLLAYACLLSAAASTGAEAKAASSEPVYRAGFQTLKQPLTIDGMLYESAYEDTQRIVLGYIDADVPGTPLNRTEVNLFYDAQNLYWAFLCKEKSKLKPGPGTNDEASILKGHNVGLILDTGAQKGEGPRYFLILSTPEGITYTASRKAGDSAWEAKWNPEGFECKAQRYVGRWSVECKLPLKGDLAALPKILGVGFLRNRSQGKPGLNSGFLNAQQSWKPLLSGPHDPKAKEVLAAWTALDTEFLFKADTSFSGHVLFPDGKQVPQAFQKLASASFKADPDQHLKDPVPSSKVRPGFAVSEKQLYDLYGGPVYMVPLFTKGAPKVDGLPDDAAWKAQAGFKLGFQEPGILGVDRVNPTTLKLGSDKQNLYVLAVCMEKHIESIRANDKALWTNDLIDFAFDIGHRHDHQAYYQVETNAKGRQLLIRGRADSRWKPKGFESVAKLDKDRWVVEVNIPFKTLGIESENFPKLWGANFIRTRWPFRPGSRTPGFSNWDTAWRANPYGTLHCPHLFGHLYFQTGKAIPKEIRERI